MAAPNNSPFPSPNHSVPPVLPAGASSNPTGSTQTALQTASVGGMSNGVVGVANQVAPVLSAAGLDRAARRLAVVRAHKEKAGRRRPLNGFIAFRTFYSPIFKGATQKVKSGLMTELWGAECKRALWTLVGNAYSDMRDCHDEKLSVEKFLSAAIPILPIVPAEMYLSKMGWSLHTTEAGELSLMRSLSFNAEQLALEYPATTNLSAKDIVKHCYDKGVLDLENRQEPPQRETLRQRLAREGLLDAGGNAAQTGGGGGGGGGPPCGGSLVLAVTPQSVQAQIATASESPEAATSGSSVLVAGEESDDSSVTTAGVDAARSSPFAIGQVNAEQQAAFERHNGALHFHPSIAPILGFDPRIVQNQFDPFDLDLSQIINYDMDEENL